MRFSLLFLVVLGLTACYESNDVTLHEPGVYKGKVDEHALSAEERAEVLRQRFIQVQTDR